MEDFASSTEVRRLPDCEELLNRVRQSTAKARHTMVRGYEQRHQIEVFEIGDLVSVHIPRQARHGTDDRPLDCLVLRKLHPDLHDLLTEFGLLN